MQPDGSKKDLILSNDTVSYLKGTLLVPRISLKHHMPRTFGEDHPEKKKDLRDKILVQIEDGLDEYKRRCRGKSLALDVVFRLWKDKEIGSPRDLDNMLKILCDTLPDFIDGNKKEPGVGLIVGNSDHSIYEIRCNKILVGNEIEEGIDLEIFEWLREEENKGTEEDRIIRAARFAKEKHRCQFRKDHKTEYWHHLEHVVSNARKLGIKDEDILCAGWLHDTIEDTDTDFDDIEQEFGQEVAEIVAAVTKDKRLREETREHDYLAQLREASWKVHVIKLCDIWANIADIPSGYKEQRKQAEQVDKKLKYFEVIKTGLYENRDKIPNLDKALDEMNALLSSYGRAVGL